MNIFELHRNVLTDYRDFVRSFFLIADDRARAFVDQALEEEQHLWPSRWCRLPSPLTAYRLTGISPCDKDIAFIVYPC